MFGKWSRRNLLQSSGVVAGAAALAPVTAVAATAASDSVVHTGTPQDNLFTQIGVRPILNARGTYTILSGSRSLPQQFSTRMKPPLLTYSRNTSSSLSRGA